VSTSRLQGGVTEGPEWAGEIAAESAVVEAQRVGVDLERKGNEVSDYLKVPASEPIPLKVPAGEALIPLSVLALDLASASSGYLRR
jgi:hypothetical protein